MPNAVATRRKDPAGTSKTENSLRILNLFRYPGLYQFAPVLDGIFSTEGRGRRSPYPPVVMLAVTAAARATGSLPEAIKVLRDRGVWEACAEAYTAKTGARIPPTPPTRDQVTFFRGKLADPQVLERFRRRFAQVAVAQARVHGNLIRGATPDWAHWDERHAIYGDGTVVTPFSDVTEWVHPRTGEKVYFGSRTNSGARMQTVFTDLREDQKTHARGINFVSLHTWTPAGRVVLGVQVALRAELWAAVDLIDEVMQSAGDGAHTLVYDRIFTGWPLDYLMGHHRLQVINKAVSRKSYNEHDGAAADPDLADQIRQELAQLGAPRGAPNVQLIRRGLLQDIFAAGQPLPVGRCLYRTSKGFDDVHSRTYATPPATHQVAGRACRHHLVIDDGGLFLTEPDPVESWSVKTYRVQCLSSGPYQRPDGGWGRRSTWLIPCPDGDFEHITTWEPTGYRRTSGSAKPGIDMAGCEERPISRGTTAFDQAHARRNDGEAWNSWTKRSLSRHGRAASLTKEQQLIDVLGAALVANADTWFVSRRD